MLFSDVESKKSSGAKNMRLINIITETRKQYKLSAFFATIKFTYKAALIKK